MDIGALFDDGMAPPWGAEAMSDPHINNAAEGKTDTEMAALPRFKGIPLLEGEWPDDTEECEERAWCFLCEVGEHGQQNRYFHMLLDYIARHYGRISDSALCFDVQDLYNRHLRPYLDHNRPWHSRTILAHIEDHATTPATLTLRSMRMLTEAMRVLEQGALRLRHSAGEEPDTLDRGNCKLYLELLAARQKLSRDWLTQHQPHAAVAATGGG